MSLYSKDWNRKIGCAPGNEPKKREKRVCCQNQQRFLQSIKHTAEEASVCKDVTLICPSEGKQLLLFQHTQETVKCADAFHLSYGRRFLSFA